MGGFDTGAVQAGSGLGEALTPVVVLAIGRPDGAAGLPGPLAAREAAPRTRYPVSDLLLPVSAASHPAAASQPTGASQPAAASQPTGERHPVAA